MNKLIIRALTVLLVALILQTSIISTAFASINDKDTPYGPKQFNVANKWTAIVSAYEPEIEAINSAFAKRDDVTITDVIHIKGVKYQLGTYKSENIIIFTTGVSVPNAAMTMQMALDYFPIDKVVMMGIAGAINPNFTPGDIAIPARWYFHDESVYVNPNPNKPGTYHLPDYYEQALSRYKEREKTDPHAPKYENFGMIHPQEIAIVKEGFSQRKKIPYFSVTPQLLALAEQAVNTIEPITMPSGKAINISIGGNGVTGSVFADNAEYRNWLSDVFNAQVTEMESAAVGQVCYINDVDWIIIRSVSDLAGGQAGKNEENVFDAIASGTGTKLMIGLLDEIVAAD
ncbi:MAG: 5'-methylthioadenosine/S-adenosylhomocysteine nucleosidase [Glaciecola sp.]